MAGRIGLLGRARVGAWIGTMAAGMFLLLGCGGDGGDDNASPNNASPSTPVTPVTPEYRLTVVFEPQGSGTYVLSPAEYKNGDEVTVTVTPRIEGKYTFAGWSGVAGQPEAVPTITVRVDRNMTLTANFIEKFVVATYAEPDSGGRVIRTPDSSYYGAGWVGLRAIANPGYRFVGWMGDTTLVDTVLFATYVARDLLYIADFRRLPQILVSKQGEGTVIASPDKDYYEEGDEVTLSATAAQGYLFVGWSSGNRFLSGDNPYTVTVGVADVELVAEFMRITN